MQITTLYRQIQFKIYFSDKHYVLLKVNCEGQPWVITPTEARFLYVQLRGHLIPGARGLEPNVTQAVGRSHCHTKNRVRVHAGGGVDVLVCPLPAESGRHPMVREVAVLPVAWSTLPIPTACHPDDLLRTPFLFLLTSTNLFLSFLSVVHTTAPPISLRTHSRTLITWKRCRK